MQISLEKFSLFLTGAVSLGLILGTGYLFFTIFFGGPKPDVLPILTANGVSIFGQKLEKATAALVGPSSKIELDKTKNLQFLNTPLFNSFIVDPDDILLSKVRGRENPFIPSYVTP